MRGMKHVVSMGERAEAGENLVAEKVDVGFKRHVVQEPPFGEQKM
jgi:hypothetical protein